MNLLADERGSALIDFAVFVSFLTFLIFGMVDYTFAIHEAMQVQAAASAGAAYGAIPGHESDTAGMKLAAGNAAAGVAGFLATPTDLWTCTPGGASVSSTATCGGVSPYKYVVVKTSGTVPKPVSFPGITSNGTVYGSAIFRVPWSQ